MKNKSLIITFIVFIVLILIIIIGYSLYNNTDNNLNGLKYGKSVVPSNSIVFAKIGPGENYTGKRTDSNVHTVKYKNSICNLDVLYYEETNDYNLEKEKEDTPNFKTIDINGYKWYTNANKTYLFTKKDNNIFVVNIDKSKKCNAFKNKLIETIEFK